MLGRLGWHLFPSIDWVSFRHRDRDRKARAESAPFQCAGWLDYDCADSIEEALAFLSQVFSDRGGDLVSYRDRVLVFDTPSTLPQLAEGAQTFIPVATSREVERELAPYLKQMHSIVVNRYYASAPVLHGEAKTVAAG